MVLDVLFLVCVAIATATIIASFVYAVYLGVLTRATRTGRVVFGAMGSLKLFVALILADFYVAILVPDLISAHRAAIRWGLVLYLLVQSLSTLIGLERLRRYGES